MTYKYVVIAVSRKNLFNGKSILLSPICNSEWVPITFYFMPPPGEYFWIHSCFETKILQRWVEKAKYVI